MKVLLQTLAPYVHLYRDSRTGIAWVEDGTSGAGHSAHPNIDASGSIRGMKQLGHWGKKDRCVRTHGFIYNIDHLTVDTGYDKVAHQHCRCGGRFCSTWTGGPKDSGDK